MKIRSILPAIATCTGWSALAAPITFTALLSGAAENPSNVSLGSGSATVVIDTTAHTLSVDISFMDLTTAATAAHIHCCVAPPGNVGVASQTPSFTGFPAATSGIYSNVFDTTLTSTFSAAFVTANGGTAAGAEAALLAGLLAGEAYVNIHTSTFPGGEIRGFLAEVPEPSSLALAAFGLAGIAALGLRRTIV